MLNELKVLSSWQRQRLIEISYITFSHLPTQISSHLFLKAMTYKED